MRLTLTRSGGFAGLQLPPVTVDTATLPPAVAQQCAALLAAADFFAFTPGPGAPHQADRFRYTLAVVMDDGRERAVDFGEENAPAPLLQLVQLLPKARRG
jgi:hypothetical protein